MQLARFLAKHPKVTKVYYPGLEDHPQHKLAGELFRTYGALMSIELADNIDCLDFLNRLQLVISSSHLGDNRTLAIPVAQTILLGDGGGASCRDGHRGFADPAVDRHRGYR